MQSTFDEILQDLFKLRRDKKAEVKSTITKEEIDAIQRRQDFEQTFMFNTIHGRMLGKDNAIAR